jgi:heme/copper-type cytochrome/quinol oxidase subunit 2
LATFSQTKGFRGQCLGFRGADHKRMKTEFTNMERVMYRLLSRQKLQMSSRILVERTLVLKRIE